MLDYSFFAGEDLLTGTFMCFKEFNITEIYHKCDGRESYSGYLVCFIPLETDPKKSFFFLCVYCITLTLQHFKGFWFLPTVLIFGLGIFLYIGANLFLSHNSNLLYLQ